MPFVAEIAYSCLWRCVMAWQAVWAPVSVQEHEEHAGDGGGNGAASAFAARADVTGVGSIFVVMAGLVKSSFTTTGGGSQVRCGACRICHITHFVTGSVFGLLLALVAGDGTVCRSQLFLRSAIL